MQKLSKKVNKNNKTLVDKQKIIDKRIKKVWKKYKYLDRFLKDPYWLKPDFKKESKHLAYIFADCWNAIKEYMEGIETRKEV